MTDETTPLNSTKNTDSNCLATSAKKACVISIIVFSVGSLAAWLIYMAVTHTNPKKEHGGLPTFPTPNPTPDPSPNSAAELDMLTAFTTKLLDLARNSIAVTTDVNKTVDANSTDMNSSVMVMTR